MQRKIVGIFVFTLLIAAAVFPAVGTMYISRNVNTEETSILDKLTHICGDFTENQGQIDDESVKYYIQGRGIWLLDDGIVFDIQEPKNPSGIPDYSNLETRFHGEIDETIHRRGVVLKLNFEDANHVALKGQILLPYRSNFFYDNNPSRWRTDVPNYHEVVYPNIYDNIDLIYRNTEEGLKYCFIVHPGGDPSVIRMRYEGVEELHIDSSGDLNIYTELGVLTDSKLFIYQDTDQGENKVEGRFKILAPMTYGFKILSGYDKGKDLVIDPLLYSTFVGSWNQDYGQDVAIDDWGNAYVTGYTVSSNFPTTTGAYDESYNQGRDVFVFKLDPTGSSLIYSTFVGGINDEEGWGIAVDSSGTSYVTGYTGSSNFPRTIGPAFGGGVWDVFVFKLDSLGSTLWYSTFVGGSSDEAGWDITIDDWGNAYVTGFTVSSNFPITITIGPCGVWAVFVFKLPPSGSMLLYSTLVGGKSGEEGWGIAVDSSYNAYVTGYTASSNFPTTSGAYDTSFNGGPGLMPCDVFVFKLDSLGSTLLYSTFVGGKLGSERGQDIAIDDSGIAYVTGYTWSSDFPTTALWAYDTTYNGGSDAFMFSLNSIGSSIFSTFFGGSNNESGQGITIGGGWVPSRFVCVTGYTTSSESDFPITSDAYDITHNGGRDVFVFKLSAYLVMKLIYSTFVGGINDEVGWGIAIDDDGNAYVSGYTKSPGFPITSDAYDTIHNGGSDVFVLKEAFDNAPPNKPDKPSGPTSVKLDTSYGYSTSTTDPDENQVFYNFSIEGKGYTGWFGPYDSGQTVGIGVIWNEPGSFNITVQAKDDPYGALSRWSDPLEVCVSSRERAFNTPFLNFLQQHPNLFPMLQILLHRLGLQ